MSRKKQNLLNPSELDLKNSAYAWIQQTNEIKEDEVPLGWVNAKQLCEIWNLSIGKVETIINKNLSSNKWEKKQFRIKIGGAGVKPTWHYRGK
jgi:hypothetical protein